MKILKGKNAGDGYRLHQWANDWMTADAPDGAPVIAKPLNVQLDGDEQRRMRESYERFLDGERHCGQFWHHWELKDDGTFARIARED
jgi:hypothetical protein